MTAEGIALGTIRSSLMISMYKYAQERYMYCKHSEKEEDRKEESMWLDRAVALQNAIDRDWKSLEKILN